MKRLCVMLGLLGIAALAQQAPPYYQRPVEPKRDSERLARELAAGTAEATEWRRIIALYSELEELFKILPMTRQLIEAFPDEPAFWEAHMIACAMSGEATAAESAADHLLAAFPGYPTAQVNAARIFANGGKRERALNLLLQAMESQHLKPNDWDLTMRLLLSIDADPASIHQRIQAKQAQFPEAKSLKMLTLALYVRFGDYDAADRWLTRYPDLVESQDTRDFQRVLADFRKPHPPADSTTR